MSQEKIDALQEELAAEEAEEISAEDLTVNEADAKAHFGLEGAEPYSDELAGAISMLSMVAGNMICTACRVDPLSEDEAGQLGRAGAEVARHYPGLEISPKAAAWFGLGMAGSAIITPRLAQYQERRQEAPEGPSGPPQDPPQAPEVVKDGLEGDPGDPGPLTAKQSPYK